MASQYDRWRTLLALKQQHSVKQEFMAAVAECQLGVFEVETGSEPIPGFYRWRENGKGPLLPIAIFQLESGALQVRVGATQVADLPLTMKIWPRCIENPVPREWWEKVVKHGERWPDEPRDSVEADVGLVGHNHPPDESEADEIRRMIENAQAVAEADYAEITTKEMADAAQALRSRITALKGRADKGRKDEKEPHLEASKAVDAKWMPVVKLGEAAVAWLSTRLSAFATKRANAEAEERRKAQAEEVRKIQEAAIAAEAAGEPLPQVVAETVAPIVPAAPERNVFKGASGRAAREKIVKVARVVDYDAAFAHLKAFPDVKLAVDRAAQRQVDAGFAVPGVEINEERKV